MSLFVQLLEVVAVFVPDFLTLGLVTLAFFNLYGIAKTLDDNNDLVAAKVKRRAGRTRVIVRYAESATCRL